jgi:hypothetical protein
MWRLSDVFLSFVFLGIFLTFADACVLNGPRYQLASDTVRWSLELSGGETCIRGVRFNNVVVNKLMVISAPGTGHVTLQGTGFSYKATNDFQGRDFFSLMVSGATNKVSGSSTIEVEVSVSNASELRRSPTMIPPSSQAHPSPPSPAGSATSSPPPLPLVNDLCGPSNDVAVGGAPTTNLCTTGTASVVSGSGPWRWSCTGNNGTTAPCSAPVQTGPSVQKPGPSAYLFANPYYTCVNNYYISTSGSDSNNGSSGSPWRTLQHADFTPRAPGDCINVSPGTYDGMILSKGGNGATSIGYVVYRCQTLDGCVINGNAGPNRNTAFWFQTNGSANYVIIDGFVMAGAGAARGPYGVGLNVSNGTNGAQIASHHVWVLNSIVSNFSQTGISFVAAEYFYALHNTVYGNAGATCNAQGSGISVFEPHSLARYMPTNDDKNNPNSFIGSFATGSDFFRIVVEWNVTYNNALTSCGTSDSPTNTDGNGIILDTFGSFNGRGNSEQYVHPTLVAFNVAYNNGGVGLHAVGSEFVTFANNSCYNNNLDPFHNGTFRGCITANASYANTYINNIAVSVTAAHTSCSSGTPYAKFNTPGLSSPPSGGSPPFPTGVNNWTNNVTLTLGQANCYGVDVPVFRPEQPYSSTANREATDPKWVDVGNSSIGNETTPAVGTNFALQADSPAIGYGKQETFLPTQSVDAGACYHTFATCP